jgi:hypothetical protein
MSSVIGDSMTSIAQTIEQELDDAMTPLVLGDGLHKWLKKVSPSGEAVTPGALVHLAVLNDALIIAEEAAMRDGVFSAEEKAYVTPLAQVAVRYLARFRNFYEEFTLGIEDVKDFVDAHMHDAQQFGGRCVDTRWAGAQICRNFAINARNDAPLKAYRETMVRLVDDVLGLTTGSDPAWRRELCAQIELKSRLERTDTIDARTLAFCSPSDVSVFHAVAHAQEVYEGDPFDVEAIHAEARDGFPGLLLTHTFFTSSRARLLPPPPGPGLARGWPGHPARRASGLIR